MTDLHPGDSAEQRTAERHMLDALGLEIGLRLDARRLQLANGARVEVDGADEGLTTLVECSARFGLPRGAQPKKILTDAFKLQWVATQLHVRPDRLILCFADAVAASPFLNLKSWGARAIADAGIKICVVELPEEVEALVRAAQTRQFR